MTVAPTGYRAAVDRLGHAQKSNRGAAGYSRWINRRAGRYLAAAAFLLGMTPNAVTAVSAVLTVTGVILIGAVQPTQTVVLVIVVMLLLGYAVDSADGQLARLRGGGTFAGEWLDHVVDALKESSIHLAVAVCWFRYFRLAHAGYLLIPLGYAVVGTVIFFATILSDLLRRIARARDVTGVTRTGRGNSDESAPVLRSLIVLPNDYGVLCLCLLLLPYHRVFGVVYTAMLAANTLFVVVGSVRWFREMRVLS